MTKFIAIATLVAIFYICIVFVANAIPFMLAAFGVGIGWKLSTFAAGKATEHNLEQHTTTMLKDLILEAQGKESSVKPAAKVKAK